MSQHSYPGNWWEISYIYKCDVKFKCERCGRPEDEENEDMISVILLVPSLPYYKPGNKVALCESCKTYVKDTPLDRLINQLEMFEDHELKWLGPHLELLGIPVPGVSAGSN